MPIPYTKADTALDDVRFPIVVEGEVFSFEDIERGPRWWWWQNAKDAWTLVKSRIAVLRAKIDTEKIDPERVDPVYVREFLETGCPIVLWRLERQTQESIEKELREEQPRPVGNPAKILVGITGHGST